MPQVNRNAPCPCGSGKKYKNCCLRQDVIREAQMLGFGTERTALFNLLTRYARAPRFASEFNAAFELYWGGRYDLQGFRDFPLADLQRTLEWFAHDYPIGEERRHIIDLFIESDAKNLPERATSWLLAWAHSAMGLFRVMATDPAGTLRLYDCLRQTELQAHDIPLAHNVYQGEVLVGRLYTWQDQHHLSPFTLILPAAYEPALTEYVGRAYQLYADEHYQQATWDRFLRDYGYLFQAFLLSEKGESLRKLIGPGTRYYDPALLRDRLRAHTLRRQQEALQEPAEEELPLQRTRSGLVLPGTAEPAPGDEGAPQQPPTILIPGRDF
jgi:hypothetical protein